MAYEFRYNRLVEFSDTDMAGIVHFSNFFKYMEAAEHAFYISLGFSVHCVIGGKVVTWVRAAAECRYTSPLRFEDTVEIHVVVREMKRVSISYDFIFRKVNEGALEEAARGSLTVVCAGREKPGDPYKAQTIPDEISALIEVAPEAVLEANGLTASNGEGIAGTCIKMQI